MSSGFVTSRVDGGLIVFHDNIDLIIFVVAVLLCINDLLIIPNEGLIGQMKDQMKKRFPMHDLGSLSSYLGTNIECPWEHHTIDCHQHSCIRIIFSTFRMDESRLVPMPIDSNLHKRKPDQEACNPTIYQSMIGGLM
jgi:hypothetical protein